MTTVSVSSGMRASRRRTSRGSKTVVVPLKTFRTMQDNTPDPAPKLRAMVEARRARD